MIYSFYQDPSHGWLKVPVKTLKELKIENQISSCSYYRKGYAYLEEDCDLAIFIKSLKEKKQITFGEGNIKASHTNRSSKIRKYESYKKEVA
jgi:uncharacterized protein YjhX (UPF0386 family)